MPAPSIRMDLSIRFPRFRPVSGRRYRLFLSEIACSQLMICAMRPPIFLFVLPKRKIAPRPVEERKGRPRAEPVYRDQAGHRDRRTFSLVRSQSWNSLAEPIPRGAASLGAALGTGRGWVFCTRFPFARHCEAPSGAAAIRPFSGDREGRNYGENVRFATPRGYPRGGPQAPFGRFN